MHRGYIKLFRKIRDSILWKKSQTKSYLEAWIDILMEVQHSDTPQKILIGNDVYECKRGQSVKSQETWAERWGWDRSKTRRFLSLLANEHMIELKTTSKTTILTVCNYDTYQNGRPTNDQQMTIKRPTNDQQMTTDNNDKNDKNDKNENNKAQSFIDYWNSKPELPQIRAFNDKRKKKFKARMKEPYFLEHWEDIIDELSKTPFCLGQNDRGWKADVSWILENSDNYVKVMEGKYNGTKVSRRNFEQQKSSYGREIQM